MATTVKRLPDLPTATSVSGGDYALLFQGGVTKKVPVSLLSAPAGTSSLGDLSDVSTAGASEGSVLSFDTTQWVATNNLTNQIYDGGNF